MCLNAACCCVCLSFAERPAVQVGQCNAHQGDSTAPRDAPPAFLQWRHWRAFRSSTVAWLGAAPEIMKPPPRLCETPLDPEAFGFVRWSLLCGISGGASAYCGVAFEAKFSCGYAKGKLTFSCTPLGLLEAFMQSCSASFNLASSSARARAARDGRPLACADAWPLAGPVSRVGCGVGATAPTRRFFCMRTHM